MKDLVAFAVGVGDRDGGAVELHSVDEESPDVARSCARFPSAAKDRPPGKCHVHRANDLVPLRVGIGPSMVKTAHGALAIRLRHSLLGHFTCAGRRQTGRHTCNATPPSRLAVQPGRQRVTSVLGYLAAEVSGALLSAGVRARRAASDSPMTLNPPQFSAGGEGSVSVHADCAPRLLRVRPGAPKRRAVCQLQDRSDAGRASRSRSTSCRPTLRQKPDTDMGAVTHRLARISSGAHFRSFSAPRVRVAEPPVTASQTIDDGAARPKGWRRYVRALGPGLITGASDDDPSGIATYSQAGARFGLSLAWSALLTFPLMAATQEICDRTALASGKGLGELARERFSRSGRMLIVVLIVALLFANALNIAADLLAIGSGMKLLGLGPPSLWALIAGATITGLLIAGSFARIATVFKALALSLLAYIPVVFLSGVHWGDVAANVFIPHVHASREYVLLLVAVLGTTISPYLFFWQSANRIEELRDEVLGGNRAVPLRERNRRAAKDKQHLSRVDVFSGMALSNLVMLAIIVACAATIGKNGPVTIQSAADAAKGLQPAGGGLAKALFALGFIGTGMLAVPVLAGSGSAGLAGLLAKRWGFSRSVREAPVFYGLVFLGTIGGAAFSLVGVNPIRLLVIVGVVNAMAAAPFLIIVMVIANDRSIMGEYQNGWLARILGWVTVAVMAAGAIAFVALS